VKHRRRAPLEFREEERSPAWTEGDPPGDERKLATVVFADLVERFIKQNRRKAKEPVKA